MGGVGEYVVGSSVLPPHMLTVGELWGSLLFATSPMHFKGLRAVGGVGEEHPPYVKYGGFPHPNTRPGAEGSHHKEKGLG